MRVTIEHRQEAGGVSGQRRTFFIDCAVLFSEEERAIIQARDLYKHDIVTPPATPLPTQAAVIGTGFMRSGGCLLALIAIPIGIASAFTRGSGEGLANLLLFGGIGLAVFAWLRRRKHQKRLENPAQPIRLRQLLSTGRFTVHAFDPAHAKALEDEIRAQLVALKGLLAGSAELGRRQSFEL